MSDDIPQETGNTAPPQLNGGFVFDLLRRNKKVIAGCAAAAFLIALVILCYFHKFWFEVAIRSLQLWETLTGQTIVSVLFLVVSAVSLWGFKKLVFGGPPVKKEAVQWIKSIFGMVCVWFAIFLFYVFLIIPPQMYQEKVQESQSLSDDKASLIHQVGILSLATNKWISPEAISKARSDSQKEFETLFFVATNRDPVRAAISSHMPEPIQIPSVTGKFDLDAVRKAKEEEIRRKKVSEALAAHDSVEAAKISEETAKANAEEAKRKADERLRVCNFVAQKFIQHLKELASDHGDSLTEDFNDGLKRNPPRIYRDYRNQNAPPQDPDKFVLAQMANNTNWNFQIMLFTGAVPSVDKMIILCPQKSISEGEWRLMRTGRLLLQRDAIGLEITIQNEQTTCRLYGAQNQLATKPVFPIEEWKAYSDQLTDFIGEVDGRYPLKGNGK